jgi:hypothetical protein
MFAFFKIRIKMLIFLISYPTFFKKGKNPSSKRSFFLIFGHKTHYAKKQVILQEKPLTKIFLDNILLSKTA